MKRTKDETEEEKVIEEAKKSFPLFSFIHCFYRFILLFLSFAFTFFIVILTSSCLASSSFKEARKPEEAWLHHHWLPPLRLLLYQMEDPEQPF